MILKFKETKVQLNHVTGRRRDDVVTHDPVRVAVGEAGGREAAVRGGEIALWKTQSRGV